VIKLVTAITINIIGLISNIVGAIVLAIPLFKTQKQIKKLSETCWDNSPFLIQSFIKDKRLGFLGLVLLIFGFFMQLSSNLFFN